jgi:hypothetical protein
VPAAILLLQALFYLFCSVINEKLKTNFFLNVVVLHCQAQTHVERRVASAFGFKIDGEGEF